MRPTRDVGVAYILLLIAGLWGAHRYYAARQGSAIAMTCISATIIGLPVTALWTLVDLFLTAGLIADYNTPERQYLATPASTAKQAEWAAWADERTERKAATARHAAK